MQKILIIGQAPPAVEQKLPYDTTMLYDWLQEIKVTKEEAQILFDFDAVYNKFPGQGNSGHKIPTYEQMLDYYNTSLKSKIANAEWIIVLGSVAKTFLLSQNALLGKRVLYLMHPSKMNWNRYQADKNKIIQPLNDFLNGIN